MQGSRILKSTAFLLFISGVCFAQTRQDQLPQIQLGTGSRWDRLMAPYRTPVVPPTDYGNSSRLDSLIRGGQLYLSLQDAIALVIEDNLDIELERFVPREADTDVLRAQGGGLLRGMFPLPIWELPQGVGGPGAPLLTTLGGSSPVSNVPTNEADLAPLTEQSSDLNIQGSFPLSAGSRIPAFDPALIGQLNWAHLTTPQPSAVLTGRNALIENNFIGNVNLVKGFATGGTVSLGYDNAWQRSNSLNSQYNPYTNASLGLTITQPLLQGFGLALNRRFIRIAKNEQRIASYAFRAQLNVTVADLIRLYWDLVSLNENRKVKQGAVDLAQRLYEDNKSQVEVGTLAPLELKRAQAEVARSKQDLADADSLILQQELVLKTVLSRNGTADPLLREARIVPTDQIEVPAQENVQPVQDLIATAFQQRPDLQQAHIQIDNSQISLKGSRNELLPQLDLVGSVQNNALAGQPVTVSTPEGTQTGFLAQPPDLGLAGGYGSALGQVFSRDFPNYAIGVQLTIPLSNRVARADVVRDQLQVRQTEVRLRQLENQVRLQVENALLAAQRSRTEYQAAVETRQLQEEALAAEQERYTVGASTSFFVIQYQRDLEQARSAEVAAKGNYAKAKAALDRSMGTTLEQNNVDIDDALHGIVRRPPAQLPVLNSK